MIFLCPNFLLIGIKVADCCQSVAACLGVHARVRAYMRVCPCVHVCVCIHACTRVHVSVCEVVCIWIAKRSSLPHVETPLVLDSQLFVTTEIEIYFLSDEFPVLSQQ